MEFNDFDNLINIVVNNTTSSDVRREAEMRLTTIINDYTLWKHTIKYIFTSNENITFFIANGLNKIIWNNWHIMSYDDQISIQNLIIERLQMTSINTSIYIRIKLEQLLATICSCSLSLQPVLSMIVDKQHYAFVYGISCINTTLDDILSDNNKITNNNKNKLLLLSQEVLF